MLRAKHRVIQHQAISQPTNESLPFSLNEDLIWLVTPLHCHCMPVLMSFASHYRPTKKTESFLLARNCAHSRFFFLYVVESLSA